MTWSPPSTVPFGHNLDPKLPFCDMREQELVMKFQHIVHSEVEPPSSKFDSSVLLLNCKLAHDMPDATRGSLKTNMFLEESVIALCKDGWNLLQYIGNNET